MKNSKFIFSVFVMFVFALMSCSDWTELETVSIETGRPWQNDPELWARYMEVLRDYKASEHFTIFAHLQNSPETAGSERDFMRCLPDSLDIVSLTNGDRFSQYDREDLKMMHDMGTKVLYHIDYACRKAEMGDLSTCLAKAVETVKTEGLDGYSFTADPLDEAATAQIVSTLVAAKSGSQLIVFEGNPLTLNAEDRAKMDFVVLNTEATDNALDLHLQILLALDDYSGIAPDKLLLGAKVGETIRDEYGVKCPAVEEIARKVIEYGPVRGIGVYNIGDDYYHAGKNYESICRVIQILNPSK